MVLTMMMLALGVAVLGVFATKVKEVASMAELADYAAKSGNRVKMKPGVYQMADLLTDDVIANEKARAMAEAQEIKRPPARMFEFSGDNNHFDLTGVTIEVDTRFLSAFKGCYVREFLVSGNQNIIEGLTITDIGNHPTDVGGNSFTVLGDDNTLRKVSINVSGSSPYGYGDLLGKGGNNVVRLRKHSGLLVSGTNTKLFGCRVVSRAFGHCFYVQGGKNTYYEDCYAEGEMRSTDDMLAETSGLAFENDFRTVYPPNVIQPGYMKSLQECGFRTYGSGSGGRITGKVTLVNCTAKNVRVGFALHANSENPPVSLTDCIAMGCERAYNLNKAHVINCRGNAQYGPLLYLFGEEKSTIDLTLLPETSNRTVNAVATICGQYHEVTLKGNRDQEHPILLGYKQPPAGEISAPISEASANGVKLINKTSMPVIAGKMAEDCTVITDTVVQRDGKKIEILRHKEYPE